MRLFCVGGIPEQPIWFQEMDKAQQEDLLKELNAALLPVDGDLMYYDLGKVSEIAIKYGKALNDINIMAMWTVENVNHPFTHGKFEEPSWFTEKNPEEQDAARVFIQEHVGRAGTPHYGMLSEAAAQEFSSKYEVGMDAVLNFARYIFCKNTGNSSLVSLAVHGPLAQMVPMQDLSQCFTSTELDTVKAAAFFGEVVRLDSGVQNIAHALETAYGLDTDEWELTHKNMIEAQKMYVRHYLMTKYTPHDRFRRAMAVLGGTSETEIRERLVRLVETAASDICGQDMKLLRKDILKTATQHFTRVITNAKEYTQEKVKRHQQETKVRGGVIRAASGHRAGRVSGGGE